MNPSTALATVLVDELWRCGVRHAVLAPGSRSAALAMAIVADGRLRLHVQIDERSAGFLALGIGRATGSPAAVVTTSGTAVPNLLPAVVEAEATAVPLLVITADRPPELQDTGANQTIHQPGIFGRYLRASTDIAVPEDRPGVVGYWRSLASRAVTRASGAGEGPAGPVHINVGFREPLVPDPGVFGESLDGRDQDQPWTSSRRTRPAPDRHDVDQLRAVTGRRGVVLLGDGADAQPWLAFAERVGWPVLAEPLSGGRQPGTIGTYDLLLRDEAFAREMQAEVAIRVGRVAVSKWLAKWLDRHPDLEHVLVSEDGRWLDPARTATRVVVADSRALVGEVCTGDLERAPRAWRDAWHDADRRARRAIDAFLDAGRDASEPRTARDLADMLPDGAALVVASSMPVRDLDATMRPRTGLRVVGNRGASGIDGFVSTALGVAAAHDGPTAALAGDLSLLHDQNGLLLAEHPDLVLVVVNNDGGGIFSFLPQARYPDGFAQVFSTPHGRDFSRLAAFHNCGYALVTVATDLHRGVEAGFTAGGVHIVEVRTDRDANVALHRGLAQAVSDALR